MEEDQHFLNLNVISATIVFEKKSNTDYNTNILIQIDTLYICKLDRIIKKSNFILMSYHSAILMLALLHRALKNYTFGVFF